MNDLPWATGRSFSSSTYGAGHSQLMLRSRVGAGLPEVKILFESVELMRLTAVYPDLVLRLATEQEEHEFRELREWTRPMLRLTLESPHGTGFVACSRVSAREVDSEAGMPFGDGKLIMIARATRPGADNA